ncbi:uncharacterized protein LOC128558658 [Mercenaria mercenaria]|uniref:uncharacterized protein LOC128558658 n=1 Tax=Mercenaria mercenaria TaxID=6596 RepID=UPI00234E961D|nr:uncharacterized protein LOC128558658 [Mercenaria mercenaria]
MFCPNVNRRRKRSTSGNMYIADQYVISLSNDDSTFGNSSTVYVLDSTCLQINQTNGTDNIVLMTGYCIIEGVCYATSISSPSDSCMVCNDSVNPFGWTNNYAKDECSESEAEEDETDTDDTDNIKLVLLVALPLSGLVLITVLIAVIVIKKKTSPRVVSTPDAGGGLYDMPRNEKFNLRKQEAWT